MATPKSIASYKTRGGKLGLAKRLEQEERRRDEEMARLEVATVPLPAWLRGDTTLPKAPPGRGPR